MNVLKLQIRALQPLLVTQLSAGEENSSAAFDFIPGSVLRGVVINGYLRKQRVADAAQDPTCRRLFFDDTVRYLNAYPVNRLGQRTLPKPLSWRVSKDDWDGPSATIYDFAIEPNKDLDNPVLPSEAFCWRDGSQVELNEPDRYISVHNASEDRNVKREGESTVYRYEAIAAGELFCAAILAENRTDLNILRPFLDGAELNLGGSRSAGYGRVRFDVQLDPDWHEYTPDKEPDKDIVILTLLSDAVLRDGNGQPTTDLDAVLGWKHLRAYQRTRVVGGFNRKWGLPLVQVPALQAGSVFVYKANQVDKQTLYQLEQEGIGERRAEGFGRIGINWHTRATLQRRSVARDSYIPSVSLSNESQKLAQQMAERRLRAVLDQRLIGAVSQLSITTPPQNTQLSRLRLTVRRAWQEHNPDLISEHLKNLKAARDQFEWARVANKRLSSWLIAGIQQDHLWENWLRPAQLPSIAGVTTQPTETIKLEYTMRLLDALLKKTVKQELTEGGVV